MDRGAWWATVHRITESDTTEHTCAQRFKDRSAALPWDQVDTKPDMVSTFPKFFLTSLAQHLRHPALSLLTAFLFSWSMRQHKVIKYTKF